MSNDNRLIWLNGDILSVNEAKINVLSPTSQFGANVFEGIRCYWNDTHKQLYAFRLEDHFKRLQDSIKIFRIEEKYTLNDFKSAFLEVIKANNYQEDIAVRQTVFIDGFGSWFSHGPVGMFVAPILKKRIDVNNIQGLKLGVSSWQRISDRNISPKSKVGANYINSRMAHLEAVQNGYDTAIILNDQGKVSEGPGSCLFMIKDGNLITPPLSASILDSITRKTIIDFCKNDLDLTVLERDIDRTELYIADEVFLCGSAMEIVPADSIDGIKFKHAEITIKVLKYYLDIVTCNNTKYLSILTPIY